MTTKQRDIGFLGVYGIPDAARILGTTPPLANGHSVNPEKLKYWIRTTITLEEMRLPSTRRLITFRDLVTMRLVAVLRSRGMSLKEIRDTETWLRENLGVQWPFISRPLWTYGSDAFVRLGERLIAVSRHGQHAMIFLNDWLSKVELDMAFDDSGLVSAWTPYHDVVINPRVQIGQPCVIGTRVPTRTISGKVLAGDSIEVVTRFYDLDREQIEHAVQWEKRLLAG